MVLIQDKLESLAEMLDAEYAPPHEDEEED